MKKHTCLLALLCLLVLVLAACGDESHSSDTGAPPPDASEGADAGDDLPPEDEPERGDAEDPSPCNPIAAQWDCMLPYPSDYFRVEDEDMPSGFRVEMRDVLPLSKLGDPLDMAKDHPADGFSVSGSLVAFFPEGVDLEGVLSWQDPEMFRKLDASPTVLLNARTGERVMHFVEVDGRTEDPSDQALLIRPLQRLEDHTRYIVAIRGLKNASGELHSVPEGFAHLRDNTESANEGLESLRERYESEVFAPLEAEGVERASLQLAWDFTTRTLEQTTHDMVTMRADVLERFRDSPPEVTILSAEEHPDPLIARKIEGTVRVPLFLDTAEAGGGLTRGADGDPEARTEVEVPFLFVIPPSVWDREVVERPARVIQYGHGFFGNRGEIERYFTYQLAHELEMVAVSIDWWGMSRVDLDHLLGSIQANPADLLDFSDRVHQSMMNHMALTRALKTTLLEAPELQKEGAPIYNPDQVYFYGVSQGHILGATYTSIAPEIRRAVFNVGGASFSLMMSRAVPFQPLLFLMRSHFTNALDVQKWMAFSQLVFDRFDPGTYAPMLQEPTLPESPASRKVLLQVGIGDSHVPNLASHFHARSLGLPLLRPSPRDLPGFKAVTGPFEGSAMVEFEFGIDPLPDLVSNFAESVNHVHDSTRRVRASVEQFDQFLSPMGRIVHTCDGPCDPN